MVEALSGGWWSPWRLAVCLVVLAAAALVLQPPSRSETWISVPCFCFLEPRCVGMPALSTSCPDSVTLMSVSVSVAAPVLSQCVF